MLLQLIWIVLEERTDWENTPLDNIIDEVEAFDGVERDTLVQALWTFMDAMLSNFDTYQVPVLEVKQRLGRVEVFGDAVLLEFVTPRLPPTPNLRPLYNGGVPVAYHRWLDEALN